jgi:signal transduction histidine kinase
MNVLDPVPVGGVRPCEANCPILHARFRGTVRATEQLRLRRGDRQRTVVITSARPESETADTTALLQFQMMRDETEIEATRRLRDLVVANITHEFRTPLSAQRASIELLRDRLAQVGPDGDADGLMASLELGTLRLTWLIDNLLESARLEAGRTSMRRQPVALDQVVEEAASMTHPLLAQRGQRLETELPFPLPAVPGDAVRLTQVFVNLLANANKYAPPASTIRVGGAVEVDTVTLWVEDGGPGLPEEQRGTLFERFVRSPGEEPEESGLGLGLWIVRSIVERHGGRVEAGAAVTECGARISVVLPIDGAGDEATPSAGTLATRGR